MLNKYDLTIEYIVALSGQTQDTEGANLCWT